MKEELSAMVDSELSRNDTDAVLQQTQYDHELFGRWNRYHLIGALLKNEHSSAAGMVSAGLANRIHERIANEPTCLAPDKDWRKERGIATRKSVIKTVVGLALAASVGGIAVLTLQPPNSAEPGAAKGPVVQRLTRWETNQPEMEADLNTLLVEHGEFTPASGLNGLMAYAKFVSYDAHR